MMMMMMMMMMAVFADYVQYLIVSSSICVPHVRGTEH